MTSCCRNPLDRAFVEAGRQAGYGYTDDLNGYRQEGFGPMDMTVHNGKRCSAAAAWAVTAGPLASRLVVIDPEDKDRKILDARGVRFIQLWSGNTSGGGDSLGLNGCPYGHDIV